MSTEQRVTVRYWASARAAADADEDVLDLPAPVRLDAVLAEVHRRHPDGRLARVLASCSLLVGERPVGAREPAEVTVPDGAAVEVLPPFAGG